MTVFDSTAVEWKVRTDTTDPVWQFSGYFWIAHRQDDNRMKSKYLCQDGTVRGMTIPGEEFPKLISNYNVDDILANQKCGWYRTLEQAETLLKQLGYKYRVVKEEKEEVEADA